MSLVSLIIIGITAMLVLVAGIIFFVVMYQRRIIRHQVQLKEINDQKQQELTHAFIEGEENERMRIASELHDDVGATLASIRLFLHAASVNPSDTSIIKQSKELLDDTIQKVRDISHKLQPATLQHLGLQASLHSFADTINGSGHIGMRYDAKTTLPRLEDNIELALYRVIQELTNNVIKHASATDIYLDSSISGNELKLTLSHNGKGLTEDMYKEFIHKKGAIGLKNIINRLQSINGNIQFVKGEDDIYHVIVTTMINA